MSEDSKVPHYVEDRNTWSPEDHLRYSRTHEMPTNPEWSKQMKAAADRAGLEYETDETDVAVEDMSPEEIYRHAQKGR